MKKYIVYITKYKGNLLPPFYIGSSYEEKVLKGYNGSIRSKKYKEIYKKEQKENKHLFITRILSYHETREKALEEELRLQKKHNVVKNEKYFNESYASINGYFGRDVAGKDNPNYGKKLSEERKEQISEIQKEYNKINGTQRFSRKKSEEEKQKLSEKAKEGYRNGRIHAKGMLNKKHSIETKEQYSKIRSGSGNARALKIKIYDNKGEVKYICNGNFKDTCEKNNLPHNALRKSYSNNGKPIYDRIDINIINRGHNIYKGWYAKKE